MAAFDSTEASIITPDNARGTRFARDQRVDSYLNEVFEGVLAEISNNYGGGLKSILLTGSAARGEAVGSFEGAPISFTSDLDLWLVFTIPGFLEFRRDCLLLSKRLSETVGRQVTEVELGPTFETLLKLMTPTIAYFDVLTSSQLVYGQRPVLKPMRADMIERVDALELVFNRVSEFLYASIQLPGTQRSYYLWSKVASDGIGAWLALKGQYVSSYSERAMRLRGRKSEIEALLSADSFRLTMDLINLRVNFSSSSVQSVLETWPEISNRQIAVLLGKISQLCLRECGMDVPRKPDAYWAAYRERLPLYVWAPYLMTKVRTMMPYIVRSGVHPKAIVNYCLLLLLWYMVDGDENHLLEAMKLLALLGQTTRPTFGALVSKAYALSRSLNGLPLKPHTPWMFHV